MIEYIELEPRREEIIGKFSFNDKFSFKDEKHQPYSNIDEAVNDALTRAFLDINYRTLDKSDEYPDLNSDENITSFLIDKLKDANFIYQFFVFFSKDASHCANEQNFDAWHHETCEIFWNVLKKYYKNAAYGKAQKIVNMMFKHLYCMKFENDGSREMLDEKYFKHCHLTLDSFTLEWFCREVAEKWYNKLDDKKRGDKIYKGKFDSWSNLGYPCPIEENDFLSYVDVKYKCNDIENCRLVKTGEKYFYHYNFFTTVTRKYFCEAPQLTEEQKRYAEYTPFQAEFFIWPEIQLHLTAEALFGQSIGQDEMIKKMEEVKKEKNTDSINQIEKKIEEKKKKNPKWKSKQIDDDLKKLKAPVEDMKEARAIYQDLSLENKLKVLERKIKLLIQYSKRECDTEQ